MSKEMIVSSNSHETKIAILEDDQVAELYFEREKNYTLAGSIYKGRVTRVLPGMQSAFVDIGLDRDAFLYVSDFLEDTEEYDRIAATVEEKVTDMEAKAATLGTTEVQVAKTPVAGPDALEANGESSGESGAASATDSDGQGSTGDSQQAGDRRSRFSRRSRRRRGRQKDFPDSKYANRQPPAETQTQSVEPVVPSAPSAPTMPVEPLVVPIILPGESLAKYRDRGPAEAFSSHYGETETVKRDKAARPVTSSAETSTPERAPASNEESSSSDSEPRRTPLTWETMSGFPSKPPVSEPEEKSSAVVSNTPEIAKSELVSSVTAHADVAETQPAVPTATSSLEAQMTNDGALENVVSADYIEEVSDAVEESNGSTFGEAAVAGEEGELSEAESAVGESGSPEDPSAPPGVQSETDKPQRASVRDRHRNPRYMRKGRWAARRGERGEPKTDAVKGQGQGQGQAPSKPREREAAPQPLIADMLKEGQEIIVQIAKEPLGKKGARITSHVALPGRYLVYMPTVDHVGVSRKISSDEERQRLKRIILEHGKGIQGGFIVRTAGAGHSEEDLRQDIQYLSSLWSEMKLTAEKTSAPVLLHHDLNLVLRILRDQFSTDFSAVWVDNEQEYERILGLVNKFQPALVNRVKLYSKDLPLFEEMGIQEEINKALKPKVWLKSGGYIVINQTEALVAIDINTGKFVGKSNRLEDTIVKTNTEAIKEIVRQIRLRDLGGIIVIDFIDMEERKNRQKVMVAMEEALRADRSPSKILAFNEFGLVAITRKRVRQSLERSLCQPCADCGGSGLVKSVATVSYEILAEAKKIAHEFEKKQITLRVNPEIGRALKTRENTILQEIEELAKKPVIIRNDPSLHIEHFDFN